MKDVKFNEIIDEIHQEFPSLIPKFIIREIINLALRTIFKEIKRANREFLFHYCDIGKIYEVTEGKAVFGLAADMDETKVKHDDDFAPFRRVDYYNIHVHNTGIGKKKTAVIYRSHRKHKVV